MRTLGLIGGLSWESTAIYYRHLNEIARARLGGLHSARLVLWSFDFADIARLQHENDWPGATAAMEDAARRVSAAGADAVVICTNTMHLMADAVERASGLPVLHIVDATAAALAARGCKRPLLLATRFTMEKPFYRERLKAMHGIDAVVPGENGREMVHRVIYEELCQGLVDPGSKAAVLDLVHAVAAVQPVDSVVLGCTEITMLIGPDDMPLPVFDTTRLHADYAMAFALGSDARAPGRDAPPHA